MERKHHMLTRVGLVLLGVATLVLGAVLVPLALVFAAAAAASELLGQRGRPRKAPWGTVFTASVMIAAIAVSVVVARSTDVETDQWQVVAVPFLMLTGIAVIRLVYGFIRPTPGPASPLGRAE